MAGGFIAAEEMMMANVDVLNLNGER